MAVLKRVVDETPRPIREIIPETPQWLCDIITKLHAKNPEERYQSAREIADVLANCESQLKTQTELKDFSLIPQRRTRHSALWKGVAVAALVVPLLAFGLNSFNRPAATHKAAENTTPKLNLGPEMAGQPTALDVPESDGWVQLFNSKDLTGWKLLPGSSGDWKVRDGILQGSTRQSRATAS